MAIQKPKTPQKPLARKIEAKKVRIKAAKKASRRKHPKHRSNREEDRSSLNRLTNFRKGLPHSNEGIVKNRDYDDFRDACESQKLASFKKLKIGVADKDFRKWESPTAGAYYDLEGADAQAVTMPPAPKLASQELALEMAEVYFMALLRDIPFTEYSTNKDVKAAVKALDSMPRDQVSGDRGKKKFTLGQFFRGEGAGVQDGPLISQFLLVGTPDITKSKTNAAAKGINSDPNGMVEYGAQLFDQRVRTALPNLDFMQTLPEWVKVQRGTDVPNIDARHFVKANDKKLAFRRFITTARDMATFVHVDQLYQAYLNACLILLSSNAALQKGFPHEGSKRTKGFAQFGGPHILTLLPEVATRALKAVRYQKFTLHRRGRPEQLAGLISQYKKFEHKKNNPFAAMKPLVKNLEAVIYKGQTLLDAVLKFNTAAIKKSKANGKPGYFLPMAFPEGSPMHPAYGAGHATVAGACVTTLKAFFRTNVKIKDTFVPTTNGKKLKKVKCKSLSIEGELNKLAANISVGRNMGGVHYYTDYSDSLLLGEKIACTILEEQLFTYPEKVTMKFNSFFSGNHKRLSNC